jgi:hypothetical protein
MGAMGAGSALPMAASMGGSGLASAAGMTTPQALGLLGTGMKMMGGDGQQQSAPAPQSAPIQQPQVLPRPKLRTFG